MSIKDTLARLMGHGLNLDDALSLIEGAPQTASQPATEPHGTIPAPSSWRKVEPIANVAPRQRRGRAYRPRTAYALTRLAERLAAGKGTKAERESFGNLYPVAADCLKAIAKARGPLTNRDIETATKHGKKSVESSVYQLRHAGLIASVALENK